MSIHLDMYTPFQFALRRNMIALVLRVFTCISSKYVPKHKRVYISPRHNDMLLYKETRRLEDKTAK